MKVGDMIELSAYANKRGVHRYEWGRVGIIIAVGQAYSASGCGFHVHWAGDVARNWMTYDRRELKFVNKRK